MNRFEEAREELEQVTTRTLQQWVLLCSLQFQSETFKFSANDLWVLGFKNQHHIRQRKIIKYISEQELSIIKKILAAAQTFQTFKASENINS